MERSEIHDLRALFLRQGAKEDGLTRRTTPRAAEPAGTAEESRENDYTQLKADLHARMIAELQEEGLLGLAPDELEATVTDWVGALLGAESLPLNEAEQQRLSRELVEEATGLGPLSPLLLDPAVTDILVNRHDQVYVERFGRLQKADVRFADSEHLLRMIERLAVASGRRIDQSSPMVDLRLADGSRMNATIPPVSIDGPTLSIRRFGRNRLRSVDVLKLRMLNDAMWTLLSAAVRTRQNVLLSGGTGAGKSTLLGILAESIPADERIVTIEDTAELILDQEHVVRLETRPPNAEGRGTLTARDLMINSLRMRPSRIILGEVRSGEALDMLQAMNTGHEGGLSTVHANSTRDALARLETMVLMAGADLPSRAIREQITSALDLVVHVRRYEDGIRRIASISEITGLEQGTPLLQDLFVYRTSGSKHGRLDGRFEATGIVPRFVHALRDAGEPFPLEIFEKPSQPLGRAR